MLEGLERVIIKIRDDFPWPCDGPTFSPDSPPPFIKSRCPAALFLIWTILKIYNFFVEGRGEFQTFGFKTLVPFPKVQMKSRGKWAALDAGIYTYRVSLVSPVQRSGMSSEMSSLGVQKNSPSLLLWRRWSSKMIFLKGFPISSSSKTNFWHAFEARRTLMRLMTKVDNFGPNKQTLRKPVQLEESQISSSFVFFRRNLPATWQKSPKVDLQMATKCQSNGFNFEKICVFLGKMPGKETKIEDDGWRCRNQPKTTTKAKHQGTWKKRCATRDDRTRNRIKRPSLVIRLTKYSVILKWHVKKWLHHRSSLTLTKTGPTGFSMTGPVPEKRKAVTEDFYNPTRW